MLALTSVLGLLAAAGADPAAVAEAAQAAAEAAREAMAAGRAGGAGLGFGVALTVFVLATFVGFEVITKIPPTLHTPLMSGSNAISGITIVGAILAAGTQLSWWTTLLGFLAVVLATINVVGGFLVTDRMLGMFRGRSRRAAATGGAGGAERGGSGT
ncbi:MAG: hypothetical protein KatS3mg102_0106 [Planctomycetota bacterium]|nr:MAG: hypothetical protein KatS3mg102_0106 [Planctomycetota bacterium]